MYAVLSSSFTVSVFSFLIIFWLIYSEVQYFFDSKFKFKFSPDTDIDAKLKINVDITVAMPCSSKLRLLGFFFY